MFITRQQLFNETTQITNTQGHVKKNGGGVLGSSKVNRTLYHDDLACIMHDAG